MILKETYYAFSFFSFPSVFYRSKTSWKLKGSKSAPTEALLSHRKCCSWNTSSVVLPLTLWLSDITPCHNVTHLHDLCPAASLARKHSYSVVVTCAGLGVCELTNQKRLGIQEGGLKKMGQCCFFFFFFFFSIKACKPIPLVTQN